MDAVRRLFFEVVAFFRRGVPLLSGLSVLLWNDPAAAVELQHLEGLLLQRAAVRACFFKLLDHQGANGVGAVAVSIAGIHSGIGVAGRAESVQESDRFSGAVAVPRLVKERLDPEDLPDDRILGEFFPEEPIMKCKQFELNAADWVSNRLSTSMADEMQSHAHFQ